MRPPISLFSPAGARSRASPAHSPALLLSLLSAAHVPFSWACRWRVRDESEGKEGGKQAGRQAGSGLQKRRCARRREYQSALGREAGWEGGERGAVSPLAGLARVALDPTNLNWVFIKFYIEPDAAQPVPAGSPPPRSLIGRVRHVGKERRRGVRVRTAARSVSIASCPSALFLRLLESCKKKKKALCAPPWD